MIEAYPLHWPEGRPRTPEGERRDSQFKTTFGQEVQRVMREINLLQTEGASLPLTRSDRIKFETVISSDLPVRSDGLPRAKAAHPADPGVAVYFDYCGEQVCFACDKWLHIKDNLRSVTLTIEALRGIRRWGTGDMLRRAFTGFKMLVAESDEWRSVFGYRSGEAVALPDLTARYRRARSAAHPDRPGGSEARFDQIEQAYQKGREELTR